MARGEELTIRIYEDTFRYGREDYDNNPWIVSIKHDYPPDAERTVCYKRLPIRMEAIMYVQAYMDGQGCLEVEKWAV